MAALACDPYVTAEEIVPRGAQPVTFDALLAQSDFVSIRSLRGDWWHFA